VNKEVPVDLAFFAELLLIDIVWPDRLDDLKYLISDVELVIESRAGAMLTFYDSQLRIMSVIIDIVLRRDGLPI
jgi:hypothetical protein